MTHGSPCAALVTGYNINVTIVLCGLLQIAVKVFYHTSTESVFL